ncbi:hypothetical protein HYH03_006962 [Edaphochlamys debaryana]|uniref:SET domain-containing protein n=1 Tax=Edaphochlamys debaryana TaxID=47281 RepID=A0A835Y300_9CHLO|nr:hypothetical protein HYH03_006962 [Edaphochlamys debaryana]|eukprot:KAG2495030.1 hypothetical protein HYH03_006962 [Edaphochlamys debaryana]
MAPRQDDDILLRLEGVKKDDQKVVTAARWLPRLELSCCDKTCRVLGGHKTDTNTILVWCTCALPDSQHPDGTRLMALDLWVVEHAKGEDLDSYEDDEDEDESGGEAPVDGLCMQAALVTRAGSNRLERPISLRLLLTRALIAQGGNRELKSIVFWVYWYDQPIPSPGSSEHRGIGTTWAPGPLTDPRTGVWYRARITGTDAATGAILVQYDADQSEDRMYLGLAFTHFGTEPPARGGQLRLLPAMEEIQNLGLSASEVAAAAGGAAGGKAKAKRPAEAPASAPPAKAPKTSGSGKEAHKDKGKDKDKKEKDKVKDKDKAAAKAAKKAAVAAAIAAGAAAAPAEAPAEAKAKAPKPAAKPAAKAGTGPAAAAAAAAAQRKKASQPAAAAAAAEAPPPAKSAAAGGNVKKGAVRSTTVTEAAGAAAAAAPPKRPSSPGAAAAAAAGATGGLSAGLTLRAAPVARPAAPRSLRRLFESLPLAAAGGVAAGPAPLFSAWAAPDSTGPGPEALRALEAAARARRGFKGLLKGCTERVPVYVFNDIDAQLPPAFEYVRQLGGGGGGGPTAASEAAARAAVKAAAESSPAVQAALATAEALCAASDPRFDAPCGRAYLEAVAAKERQAGGGAAGAGGGGGGGAAAAGPPYDKDGRLLTTRPLGLHECCAACTEPACRGNMQLARGIRRPLEVFRLPPSATPSSSAAASAVPGWGLRCAEPLRPGDLVAPLVGRIVPAAAVAAEAQAGPAGAGAGPGLGLPPGVILLDHFFSLWQAVFEVGIIKIESLVRLWQVPPNPLTAALPQPNGTHAHKALATAAAAGAAKGTSASDGSPAAPADAEAAAAAGPGLSAVTAGMLALDFRQSGNVARFVRQWISPPSGSAAPGSGSGPALVVQPVLGGGCRTTLAYHVGLYAARHVAAGEELTADFAALGA